MSLKAYSAQHMKIYLEAVELDMKPSSSSCNSRFFKRWSTADSSCWITCQQSNCWHHKQLVLSLLIHSAIHSFTTFTAYIQIINSIAVQQSSLYSLSPSAKLHLSVLSPLYVILLINFPNTPSDDQEIHDLPTAFYILSTSEYAPAGQMLNFV